MFLTIGQMRQVAVSSCSVPSESRFFRESVYNYVEPTEIPLNSYDQFYALKKETKNKCSP
jgi:hypothetical protein